MLRCGVAILDRDPFPDPDPEAGAGTDSSPPSSSLPSCPDVSPTGTGISAVGGPAQPQAGAGACGRVAAGEPKAAQWKARGPSYACQSGVDSGKCDIVVVVGRGGGGGGAPCCVE